MKSLIQYIKEDGNTKVRDVKVSFASVQNPVVVATPTSFGEDEMQIFLDDSVLDRMPASSPDFEKVIGDNKNNITDAYFEYDKYDVGDTPGGNVTVPWDPKVGGSDDKELKYWKLDSLRYVIVFSEFNIVGDDVDETLNKIFSAFSSGEDNDWPVEIALDAKGGGITHE